MITELRARIGETEWNIAAAISAHAASRRAALAWSHSRRQYAVAVIATLIAVLLPWQAGTTITLAAIAAIEETTRIADHVHYVTDEDTNPCPFCPAAEDGPDEGGKRRYVDDPLRPHGGFGRDTAPAEAADDIDSQYAALCDAWRDGALR